MRTYDIINAGPENRFMANGRIVSNSGSIVQLQNLYRNSLPDLSEARALVSYGDYTALEALYTSVPEVLSQCVRTAFIAAPGYKLIVADFSAIEARVIAWLAGEEWRQRAFAEGKDIYCASASQMFGVPVEKHGINGHLRQKGKIAELACIAEGQLVLTDRGEIPIEQVELDDKVWDGKGWISHDGIIYRGEREVITYEGLTATPDHLVFIEGQNEPIQFALAASCGAHLVQTGDGRRAIRLGEDNWSGKAVEQGNESMLCADRMSRLRFNPVAESGESEKRQKQRVPEVYTAKTDSQMAGQKTDSSKAKMRKSKRQGLPKLRWQRNKVRLSECNGSRAFFNSGIWPAGQGDGDRQNRHKQGLCSRESSVCRSQDELRESKTECTESIRARVLAVCQECGDTQALVRSDKGRHHQRCGNGSIREKEKLAWYTGKAKVYDIRNAGRHHRFTVSGRLVHNCGYGGSVGALKAMGALEMGLKEEELSDLIRDWRTANPAIVRLWWAVDKAVKTAIKEKTTTKTHGLSFSYKGAMLYITLPSSRQLCYVRPRMGQNRFGGESVTYMGNDITRNFSRIETFGGKLVENCIAKGTLIITDQGFIPIEKITNEMKIWDGEEFVSHEGLIYQGKREVLNVNGIHMTPEHKILTERGWIESGKSYGLTWAEATLPDGKQETESCQIMIDSSVGDLRPVYDILNCGPRHRFVVWNGERGLIVSNCVQAISRDILCFAMQNLSEYRICAHVHDEVIIEAPPETTVETICSLMAAVPPWAEGLVLRADGYECKDGFYMKD